MSDDSHAEVLEEFRAVTGANADRAKFYLESANWNIQVCGMGCWAQENNLSNETERWQRRKRLSVLRKSASHTLLGVLCMRVRVCWCA